MAFTFEQLMAMFLHWDEGERSRFSDTDYEIILHRLNDLSAEFGRPWVERLAGVRKTSDSVIIDAVGNDDIGDGARGIMRAVQFHEDWAVVKQCTNVDGLRRKLHRAHDEDNADLEVHVAAALVREGSILELEPELASGRHSDFRVCIEHEPWLYGEVSRRSNPVRKLETALDGLLDRCLRLSAGCACSLNIVDEFSQEAHPLIDEWLHSLIDTIAASPDLVFAELDGVAELRRFAHGHDGTTEILSTRPPPLQVRSKGDFHARSFATVYYHVPDPGFWNKFRDELKQLPTNAPSAIFLDVTKTAGGLGHWRDEAKMALADPANAHVLAVILLARGIDHTSYPRWRFDSTIALNTARQSDWPDFLTLIARAFPAA